ncbi:MAG: putative capsule biosynthesis protein [Candidatus Accumulibacter vicinus]|uniref:Putative capsule biosynthesis protein n=1 Tax=Candidatus Accumulibacter vicinus TaxID=2954382 RepID=A0A084Y2K6_9PROT|nr:MAG: putative capsule biosynthesis protein [Candidatus Accumulibacter vicinus]
MLSPAYDLTPTASISIERRDLAMVCGDAGRLASATNLLSQHARFLLDRPEAIAIIDAMEAKVRASGYPTVRAAGVSLMNMPDAS